MKVKIDGVIYDSAVEPIAIQFTDRDKLNIISMPPEEDTLLTIPMHANNMSDEDIVRATDFRDRPKDK